MWRDLRRTCSLLYHKLNATRRRRNAIGHKLLRTNHSLRVLKSNRMTEVRLGIVIKYPNIILNPEISSKKAVLVPFTAAVIEIPNVLVL